MGRYVLITNLWGRNPHMITKNLYLWDSKNINNNPLFLDSEKYEFDTKEELNEHIKLFEGICSTYEQAEQKRNNNSYYDHSKSYVFDGPNKRAWGWLSGDKEEVKILGWGGAKLRDYNKQTDKRILFDILFRGPDEIPKGYKWDEGEYTGWLQFRWGDGKNAIDYVEPEKKKRKKRIEDIAEDHSPEYEALYRLMDERDKWIKEHPKEYSDYLNTLTKKYDEYVTDETDERFKKLEELNRMISDIEAQMLADDDDWVDEKAERESDFADALEDAFAKAEEREKKKILEERW